APRLGLEQHAREADVAPEIAKLHAQAEGASARAAPSRSARGGGGPYQLRAGGRPSTRALELRAAERRGRWSGRGAPEHWTGPGQFGGEAETGAAAPSPPAGSCSGVTTEVARTACRAPSARGNPPRGW